MPVYSALIVDDERLARQEMRHLLAEHPEIRVCGEADSIRAAAALIKAASPDLVFLDVQLPGESGFDLFERVALHAHVIFVTAYDEYAVRAFEVNALDYLLKPVNPERLRASIRRFLAQPRPAHLPTRRLAFTDSVFLAVDQNPRLVKLASIVCILAAGDYSRLVSTDGPVGLVLKSLKEWERLLPDRHFCRIHRSAIVNCGQVLRLEKWFDDAYRVHLRHLPEPLTMSRRYAAQFRRRFGV